MSIRVVLIKGMEDCGPFWFRSPNNVEEINYAFPTMVGPVCGCTTVCTILAVMVKGVFQSLFCVCLPWGVGTPSEVHVMCVL